MANFTHHAFFVAMLFKRFELFLFLLLKVTFIEVAIYNHATNLQPSCIIIYNHTCLMVAESFNWTVVEVQPKTTLINEKTHFDKNVTLFLANMLL